MAEVSLVKLFSGDRHWTSMITTLVQVLTWCHQAASHLLNQCWPRSMSPYGVIRPQRVNFHKWHEITFNPWCLQGSSDQFLWWQTPPWHVYDLLIPQWSDSCRLEAQGNLSIWLNPLNLSHEPDKMAWKLDQEDPCHQCPWWRHQMETFPALLALCEGNPPVTGRFPSQRPVTQSFNVFFDLHLNKQLNKQSRCRWFETPLHLLWHHCNDMSMFSGQEMVWEILPDSMQSSQLSRSIITMSNFSEVITSYVECQWSAIFRQFSQMYLKYTFHVECILQVPSSL